MKMAQDTYLTDLPGLVLGGFTPARGSGVGWVPFEYELDDFAGTGLSTGAWSNAPELTLDLGLAGWHELHFCHSHTLRVRLDGEDSYRDMEVVQGAQIRDYMLCRADLTGRKVCIAPASNSFGSSPVILFYLRGVPCDGPRASARNLVVTEDGHGVFWRGLDSARELRKWFYPYKDSDVFRVLWGVFGGGDYDTDPDATHAGTIIPHDDEHAFYPEHRTFDQSIRNVISSGEQPLEAAVKGAREAGLEIHFYFRVGNFAGLFPQQEHCSRYYVEHPEFHCRDESGREVLRLSFAFPEVQDHLIAYFEELLRYDPDGICLAFNRGLPVMICEQPVLDAFEQRHGRAPKLPEETDSSEMQRVRHELLADFVGRAQARLGDHGKALSCIVPRNFEENMRRGLDARLLVERGVIESVVVGAGHEDNPLYTSRNNLPPVAQDDMGPLKQLKAMGKARIFLGGCSGHGTFWPAGDEGTRLRRMKGILDAGLDGAYFWDVNEWFANEWDSIRQYGTRGYVEAAIADARPAPVWRDTKWIEGLRNDRYSPWNAH